MMEKMIRERYYDDIKPEEWFTESVMWQTTRFRTFREFLEASGTGARTVSELDAVADGSALDAFVSRHSQFPSWKAFRSYAERRFFGCI